MIRPITIDGALFDCALEALQRALHGGMAERGEASFAFGVLYTLQHRSAEKASAPAQDPTEPYRREVELLSAAIKRAGFRIDRFDTLSGCKLALYPVAYPAKPLPPGPRSADRDLPESRDDVP